MPPNDPNKPGGGADVLDRTETVTRTKRPPLYRVVLHNDDFTPVELVLLVLQQVFRMTMEEAFSVMQAAHTGGACTCGVFPHDVAETKVSEAHDMAKAYDFALQFTLEKE